MTVQTRTFKVVLADGAKKDLRKLNASVALEVVKRIGRVAQNPRAANEGGYGHPLAGNLAGLFKIKLRSRGLRVVYALREIEGEMLVIVVAARDGGEVYRLAEKRLRFLKSM